MPRQPSFAKGLAKIHRSADAGFTLIELMIGMAIGLLATLAITQTLLVSEGQKRTATAGSNAQVGGVLALSTLRQSIQMAGYGFSSSPDSIGCQVEARFNGADPWAAATPVAPQMVPVVITNGASGAPDSIRVLSSSKNSFSVPIRIIAPGYNPALAGFETAFPIASVRSVAQGDLMVAVTDSTTTCQVFQASADPGALSQVDRADDSAKWNLAGYPDRAYNDGQFLINMGAFNDVTYSVGVRNTLQSNTFVLAADSTPSYSGPVNLFSNIVNLQAYYGKDTDANGSVDTWDNVTPTTNAGWLQVLAIRVAVVSQSNQFEKTDSNNKNVTETNPLWDVGADSLITEAAACGTSKCVPLKVDHLTDWKQYRYKVFDTIVPLRNMIWRS